jgi:hypothetical protein
MLTGYVMKVNIMKFEMARSRWTTFGVLGLVLASTSGCSSLSGALGLEKTSPDEFAVVTKAPLIIPPDFSLRPPKPGAKRPNVKGPSESAAEALFKTAGYEASDAEQSQGEQVLVEVAGADETDGTIRTIVEDDYQEANKPRKTVLQKAAFWSKDEDSAQPSSVAGSAAKEAEIANQRYTERGDRKTFAERVFFWRKDKDEKAEEAAAEVVEEAETVAPVPTEVVETEELSEEASETASE